MPPIPRIEKPQPAPRTMYLGIDPGKAGGLVLLDRTKVELYQMPQTEKDLWNIVWRAGTEEYQMDSILKNYVKHPIVCCIEQVSTSPQMGVVSAGSFMYGFGLLKMALTAAEVPFEDVRPQVWQKALRIPPRDNGKKVKVKNAKGKLVTKKVGGETDSQWKDRLRRKAQQLYPKLDIWQATLTAQRGIADALLIAHYCREKHQGRLG